MISNVLTLKDLQDALMEQTITLGEMFKIEVAEFKKAMESGKVKEIVQPNLDMDMEMEEVQSKTETTQEAAIMQVMLQHKVTEDKRDSWAVKQRQWSRDTAIYSTKSWMRSEILQLYYKDKFRVLRQEVLVSEENPPKLLKNRRDFSFLVGIRVYYLNIGEVTVEMRLIIAYDGFTRKSKEFG